MAPLLEEDTFPSYPDIFAGLGHETDGTLGECAVLHQTAVVHMPPSLSFQQACTLTCSGLTAWNALFGGGKKVGKGDVVVTQGTGGVSIAALQVSLLSRSFSTIMRSVGPSKVSFILYLD